MNGVSVSDQVCSSEFVEVDPTGRYGRYNEILGKGASKTVYRAFDEYGGIEVAWNQVKLHDFLQNPEDLERLYCEIHLLKTLKHKHIMKFYTSWVDTSNRNINFVTEMFTSGTLRQYRLKHRKVNIRAVKHWCRQILKGLLYLHSLNPPVIHRDLKCDNIFINGNQGQVKIGDLGLAAILRKSRAAHCVVGTPEFMAPEVYEERYNELVDIYAFGMCVLEMVTFEYPYSECTHTAQIYKKVISGKKPEALYKVEDLEVRRFIEKCLATVAHRLTARELLEDRFLQVDDHGYDLRPIEYDTSEFDEMSYYGIHQNNRPSLVNAYGCYLGYDDPANEFDYNPVEYETTAIDLFPCGEEDDKHLGDFEITIQGRRREDDGIFLRLRIADKDGRIRNIYFPFDVDNDTALSVATEMVNELDMTDQDVTRIADMIDGEISTLVPEWKTGFQSLCHNCASNASPIIDYVASENPTSKALQVLECSKHSCTSIHGRFEEITYQVDEPSCQSNGSHYTDIWAERDRPESISEMSTRDIFCDRVNATSTSHSRFASLDECGNAIRQELRWLKAKYQLQLRQLRDQQLRLDRKAPILVTSPDQAEPNKDDESSSMLFKLEPSLCSKIFGSSFVGEPGSCSPDQMFTAKRFYSGDFLPQSLHRATSLPVDAIDF